MFTAIRRWRQQRILRTQAIPEGLWRDSLESLPFLAIYTDAELARLREKVVLFLNSKSIVGARGHSVTPRQRVVIALQACVLVLNLDLMYYDGWENVIVYPDEFVPGWEWEDEAGVVHRQDEPMAGEAMDRGPVILSWADVEASQDWDRGGHEPRDSRIRAQARHAQRRCQRMPPAARGNGAACLEADDDRGPTNTSASA
jgi:Mlc titration factor MtfA (ptsG expression regulator)